MSTDWQISLQGAYATPDLVGREEILRTVLGRIQAQEKSGPAMVFLRGPGGIGKTRLLTEIIKRCQDLPGVKASGHLIDVYHLLYHTPYEMTQAIYESLKPLPEPFRRYERDCRALERVRLSGEGSRIEAQRDRALRSFLEDLGAYAAGQRVIILLDTVERFVYAPSNLPEGTHQLAEVWDWLVRELSRVPNVMIVAAGRSTADALFDTLSPAAAETRIEVDAFSSKETAEYFGAAARMARQNKAEEVAVRLESLSPEETEQAYQLTGGRPILLALLADYVSSGGLLSPLFVEVLGATGRSLQERFQDRLLVRLLNAPVIGEVLRCMVLMTKGVDVELLAAAMAISSSEAREHLRQIEKLSFVKIRRSYQRQPKVIYFLHDELYELLQRAAFVGHHGYDEKQTIYAKVIDCYEERFRLVRHDLAVLYSVAQAGAADVIDYDKLNDLVAQRTEVLLTLLYYRLHDEPAKGYRRWFRYDHEAIISGDFLFSIQLQLELQSYLREVQNDGVEELPVWAADLQSWSLLIRPVKQAWTGQDFLTVQEAARRLENSYPSMLANPLKRASLSVWEAYALVATDPPSAHREMHEIICELETYQNSEEDETLRWLAQALLAFTYRVRGYAYRTQQLIGPAIDYYRQAAVLLREVDLKIEMATVNNDLGFALALQGEWDDARSLVENALEMRGDLGLGMQVASSLNTLAIIDTYEGRYPEAIENATKSLNLSRAVEDRRRTGMALIALAEATRRQTTALSGAGVEDRIDKLNRAYEMADEALGIFTEEVRENSRKVEALLEKGCARRDAIRLIRESPTSLYSEEKWIRESELALEEAAEIASQLIEKPRVHYRQVDALVNLAWLGYYAGGEKGEAIQQTAEARAYDLLQGYELVQGQPRPEVFGKIEYQPLLSTQLGKLHVLRGHQTYTAHANAWKEREPDLAGDQVKTVYRKLAQEYFLGLEHSTLYSLEYRDLRLAKQQIYNNLKALRPANIKLILMYLEEIEQYYKIASSQLRQMMVKRALVTS